MHSVNVTETAFDINYAKTEFSSMCFFLVSMFCLLYILFCPTWLGIID